MAQGKNRSNILRAIVAVLVAIALWGVTALSDTYETTISAPLRVELPSDLALAREAPESIEVTIRAQGWSLLKMLATGQAEFVVRPNSYRGNGVEEKIVTLTSRDLLANLRTSITDAQDLRVSPDSLILVIGHVASKRAPLYPEVVINARDGFQVVGPLQLKPDSVTLTGAASVLKELSVWPTELLVLDDVHKPIRRQVRISDTLKGVLTPYQQVAELSADVQEIAERSYVDIPLVNRGTIRDTNITLVIQPPIVNVMIRGGARDLGWLQPASIGAYIDVQEGVDTLGLARPRLILPPGFSVVSIKPDRVRYLYRKKG